MRTTDYLIVGQGICGTLLSWNFFNYGIDHIVIDNNNSASASRVAAGVINPVTGRRIVKTWMIDTILPFAKSCYDKLGHELGISAISETRIVSQFPSAQMRNAFADRIAEDPQFLHLPSNNNAFTEFFEYPFGHGEITPAYIVQLQPILSAYRQRLLNEGILHEEEFEESAVVVGNSGVQYNGVRARKIIFCDGITSATGKWFKNIPFALNKGEALVVRVPELPQDLIHKKTLTLVPLGDHLFWAGASYEWDFTDEVPSADFLERTKRQLKHWLKVPFEIEGHVASIRPATLERRPFVGLHPHIPEVGILNGMGTKGCSLAPYFAAQFVDHLTKNTAILPEVNINRFSRILQATT